MKILVVGGAGYFGSLLVEELLRYSDCRIVLGGRSLDRLNRFRQQLSPAWQQRTETQHVDLNTPSSVEESLSGVEVAVCAAGPFQGLPHTLLQACIKTNVAYVDISDDRAFVLEAHRMSRELEGNSITRAICSGWSAVPGLSVLLTDLAAENMESITRIRIQIAPGNRYPRTYGTVASLLSSIGKRFEIWQDGAWTTACGWSQPAKFRFPAPVGSQRGYLVDVPDLSLFPDMFKAATVEFRVGAEISTLNDACSVLASITAAGMVKSWTPWAPVLQRLMSITGFMGHDWGAIGVECLGSSAGRIVHGKACIVAETKGQYIPVMAATIMCMRLCTAGHAVRGIYPLRQWLSKDELQAECSRRDYRLVIGDV